MIEAYLYFDLRTGCWVVDCSFPNPRTGKPDRIEHPLLGMNSEAEAKRDAIAYLGDVEYRLHIGEYQ